jgi:hypothetical protein
VFLTKFKTGTSCISSSSQPKGWARLAIDFLYGGQFDRTRILVDTTRLHQQSKGSKIMPVQPIIAPLSDDYFVAK